MISKMMIQDFTVFPYTMQTCTPQSRFEVCDRGYDDQMCNLTFQRQFPTRTNIISTHEYFLFLRRISKTESEHISSSGRVGYKADNVSTKNRQ